VCHHEHGDFCCSFEISGFVDGWRTLVIEAIVLQYVGFETSANTPSLFGPAANSPSTFVTIANAAFVAHRVRYQDAPDICSLHLHREVAAKHDRPPSTRFSITDAELAEYMKAHAPKATPGVSNHREDKEA
jgi:hypothetical protein